MADAVQIAEIPVATWRAVYRSQIPDAVLNGQTVEWRAAFWRERLSQSEVLVLVAEDEGVFAFRDLIPSRDKDADSKLVAEIAAVYVLPKHWRQGAGRALCDCALAEASRQRFKAVTLWALNSNDAARSFYSALGFSLDGATKTESMAGGYRLNEVRFRILI